MTKMQSWMLLLSRILMSLIFIAAGVEKIGSYAATQAYMQSGGIPGTLLPLVILAEVGGGLAILLGLFTKQSAVLLAGFTLASAAVFHHNFADQTQMTMFMKNLAIAGGFLALVANGAGRFSLDARRVT